MANFVPGKGTLLKMKISGTFTAIANRVEIEGPDAELGIRKTTNLDSTFEGKRPTVPDLGQVTMTVFYDPNDSAHGTARARVFSPPSAPDLFEIIWADGDTTPSQDAFSGYITKWTPTGIKVDDTLQAKVTIELTDAYTFTAGTP